MWRWRGPAGVAAAVSAAFVLVLAGPAGAGHPTWIGDGDAQPDSMPDRFEVAEGQQTVELTFTVPLDPTHPALWRTESVTAVQGEDFHAASGRWPAPSADEEQRPVAVIRLVDDRISEDVERLGVMVWVDGYGKWTGVGPADGAECASDEFCDYAMVDIRDDDGPAVTAPAAPSRAGATGTAPASASRSPSPPAPVTGGSAGRPASTVATGPPPSPTHGASVVAAPPAPVPMPGPGFELRGAALGGDPAHGGRPDDGGGGTAGPLPAVALGAAGLGTWAWRRRWAW